MCLVAHYCYYVDWRKKEGDSGGFRYFFSEAGSVLVLSNRYLRTSPIYWTSWNWTFRTFFEFSECFLSAFWIVLSFGPYFYDSFSFWLYFSSRSALDATLSNSSSFPYLDVLNSRSGVIFFLPLAALLAFKLDLLILLLFITADDDILNLLTVFYKYLFPSSRCFILLLRLVS